MITDDFKQYVASTVARHLKGSSPLPFEQIRDTACYEMRLHIATLTDDFAQREAMARYAEAQLKTGLLSQTCSTDPLSPF